MQPSWHCDPLPDFLRLRPRLFAIACRILSSAAEAEDIVQEVWLRWQASDRSAVLDPLAFLATATSRLAINAAHSAHARHEIGVGPWLPEPVDDASDPHLGAARAEALEFAVLLLLEKLSPAERAAYILREAFAYPYRQIAEVLRLEVANTRQLMTRARQHMAAERHLPVSACEQRRLLEALHTAVRSGDLAELETLFASGGVSPSDPGPDLRPAAVATSFAPARALQMLWAIRAGKRPAIPGQNKPLAA